MSQIVSGSRRKGVKLATMLVSPLLVFAGAIGVGIGLGLQAMAANLLSGFNIHKKIWPVVELKFFFLLFICNVK